MFDTTNQNCAFAEQVAAFLYGELETESKSAFETHLKSCCACADEMKSFGAVRASIADWRALEFDLLATPAIDFRPIQNHAVIKTKDASWLDGLRRIFSPAPAFAFATALLFVVVCGGLIAYNFSGGNQISDNQNPQNAPQTNASTAQKNSTAAMVTPNESNENDKQFLAGNSVESKTASDKSAAEPRTVKISNRAEAKQKVIAQKTFKTSANRAAFGADATVAQNNYKTVNNRRAPKLSSIEDDEDDASLRLSDLLDDAGGK